MSRSPVSSSARLVGSVCVLALLTLLGAASAAAQTPPVLLTEGTGQTTRAVAFESVNRRAEPFPVTSPVAWSADRRTRVTLFLMNLSLLPGEGAGALSADAEDGSGRRYVLKVESLTKPPFIQFVNNQRIDTPQDWLYAVTVRLSDEMTDAVGDVHVRFSLHGVASNRARLAIGQFGGGLSDQVAGAAPAPAPPTPPAPLPPLAPKAYGPGEASTADATRFLEQSSWGPTGAEVARAQGVGLRAYLEEQLNAPALFPAKTTNYPDLQFPPDDPATACPAGSPQECSRDNFTMYPIQRTFFVNALSAPDPSDPSGQLRQQNQLRQRVAFALHQIFVVSGRDINRPSWMTPYLQTLDRNAFGNFRTLLQEITLNPAMGEYLDMRRSTAGNPNENFAREVLQLFSIGVNELNTDGTPRTDAQGAPLPSYTQTTVDEFTRVLTGFNFSTPIAAGVTNYRDPMVPRGGATHDVRAKTLLNGAVVPACSGTNAACAQQDLNAALDNIFNHANVGPFIGKQLIQHLVTSNPSPAYVERVARAFNNDCDALYADGCANARGNLRAVVRAILLDPEARGDFKTDPAYGRLREPVQYITNVLRAFNAKSFDRTTASDGVLASRSADFPNTMDQPLFLPATVFSYYQPDYEVPGTGLVGPPFQILSTSTTLRRANFVNTMVYTGVTVNADRPRGTSLDLASLQAVAADPQQLVSQLDALLLHGTMSAQMRAAVVAAVSAIPTSDANFALKRAQTAAYLVATSSQYDIQR